MDGALEIKIPNLGEGVRYVTVKNILRSNGDFVREDEGLIEVETDKAVVEIPSPTEGCICNLTCKPGDVLPVGFNFLIIKNGAENEHGVVFANSVQKRKKDIFTPNNVNIDSARGSNVRTLSERQRALSVSMKKSASIVVPATIERDIVWDSIDVIKKYFRTNGSSVVPGSLEIICWAILKSIEKFEKFKIKIDHDDALIFLEKTVIGIAVADDNDDLLNHVVSIDADCEIVDFSKAFRYSLSRCEQGYHSVSLSDMSSLGVRRAAPIVVYPSVATIFIGSPCDVFSKNGWRREACIAVTFDHRVMNGAYVAAFLKDFELNIKSYAKSLGV